MISYTASVDPWSVSGGYDGPETFATAQLAWAYLLLVRQRDEGPETTTHSSATEDLLDALSRGHAAFLRYARDNPTSAALIWSDGTGSVYGPSPGYEGHHDDIRMTYTVTIEHG